MKLDIKHILDRYTYVKVDSAVIMHCISADEEKGIAEAYCFDNNGKLIICPETTEVQTETLHGKVEVCLYDWAPEWAKDEYSRFRRLE